MSKEHGHEPPTPAGLPETPEERSTLYLARVKTFAR